MPRCTAYSVEGRRCRRGATHGYLCEEHEIMRRMKANNGPLLDPLLNADLNLNLDLNLDLGATYPLGLNDADLGLGGLGLGDPLFTNSRDLGLGLNALDLYGIWNSADLWRVPIVNYVPIPVVTHWVQAPPAAHAAPQQVRMPPAGPAPTHSAPGGGGGAPSWHVLAPVLAQYANHVLRSLITHRPGLIVQGVLNTEGVGAGGGITTLWLKGYPLRSGGVVDIADRTAIAANPTGRAVFVGLPGCRIHHAAAPAAPQEPPVCPPFGDALVSAHQISKASGAPVAHARMDASGAWVFRPTARAMRGEVDVAFTERAALKAMGDTVAREFADRAAAATDPASPAALAQLYITAFQGRNLAQLFHVAYYPAAGAHLPDMVNALFTMAPNLVGDHRNFSSRLDMP